MRGLIGIGRLLRSIQNWWCDAEVEGDMAGRGDEWETPSDFYGKLNKFYKFTLDAAAKSHNSKCKDFLTQAFKQDWGGHHQAIWCNPPYSRGLDRWMDLFRLKRHMYDRIVVLIPTNSDTYWWQSGVNSTVAIVFLKQRITFKGAANNARFPCNLFIFGKHLVEEPEQIFLKEFGRLWLTQNH
jgi:phage N-6-adenine-methyltransferase